MCLALGQDPQLDRTSLCDLDAPPVLTVTPQGIEIRNPASGWFLAVCTFLIAGVLATGAVVAWPPALSLGAVVLTAALVLAAAVSGGMTFRAKGNYMLSAPTLLYVTAAAVVLGPLAAVLAGALAGGRSISSPRQARVYSAGMGGLQGIGAALAASSFTQASHLRLIVECAAVAAAGGCVWFAGQALVCIVRRLPEPTVRLRQVDAPSTGAEVLVALAMAPPMILLYDSAGIVPLIIFIGVLISAFALFRDYRGKLLDLHAEVERLSQTDPLTGAANRRAFDDRVDHELRRMSRGGTHFGLVLIDVNCFKALNDTYGHVAGDEMLKEVSRRLTSRLRDEDLLARIGGDEFATIVTNVSDAATVDAVASDLHRVVADRQFVWRDEQITVTISAGGLLSNDQLETPDDLLREADQALYRDKADGKEAELREVAGAA